MKVLLDMVHLLCMYLYNVFPEIEALISYISSHTIAPFNTLSLSLFIIMAVYVNHTALSISDSSLSSSSEPTVVSTSKFRFTGSEVIKESDTVITVDENEDLSPGTSVKTTGEILYWSGSGVDWRDNWWLLVEGL